MKSSGPVERLLRALGRRDSSRATSRVGVPAAGQRRGRGGGVGSGGGGQDAGQALFSIPASSVFSPWPPSLLTLPLWGVQGCGMRQQKFGLKQDLLSVLATLSPSLP